MRAFNIRGTNGSGKTHTAKSILERSKAVVIKSVPLKTPNKSKPLIYRGHLYDLPIYFLGSYRQHCGGCDTIDSVHTVAQMLDRFLRENKQGLLVYEGLLISHMIGTVGQVAAQYNDRHVMGFLDTPMEVCISRVRERRLEHGNPKPFDPNRTLIPDYRRVLQAKANAERLGYQVVSVRWQLALEQSLEILEDLGEKEWDTSTKKSHTGL